MPELPEVETIARELRPDLVGRTITAAWLDWPRQVKHPSLDEFKGGLKGREILSVDRRAKWIVVNLGPGGGARSAKGEPAVMAIQVKMTGQLDVVAPDAPRDKHVHARFSLDDGRELRLRDTRKFGRFGLYSMQDAAKLLGTLGPEPLSEELTPRVFRSPAALAQGTAQDTADEPGIPRGRGQHLRRRSALARAPASAAQCGRVKHRPGARPVRRRCATCSTRRSAGAARASTRTALRRGAARCSTS